MIYVGDVARLDVSEITAIGFAGSMPTDDGRDDWRAEYLRMVVQAATMPLPRRASLRSRGWASAMAMLYAARAFRR